MDDTSHVATNNYENVIIYNDHLYFEEPIQDNQNFRFDV